MISSVHKTDQSYSFHMKGLTSIKKSTNFPTKKSHRKTRKSKKVKNSKMVSKFKNLTKHLPIKGRRSEVNKIAPSLTIPWLIEYHHSNSCVTRGLSEGGARPTRYGASGSSDCPVAKSENVTPFRF